MQAPRRDDDEVSDRAGGTAGGGYGEAYSPTPGDDRSVWHRDGSLAYVVPSSEAGSGRRGCRGARAAFEIRSCVDIFIHWCIARFRRAASDCAR